MVIKNSCHANKSTVNLIQFIEHKKIFILIKSWTKKMSFVLSFIQQKFLNIENNFKSINKVKIDLKIISN